MCPTRTARDLIVPAGDRKIKCRAFVDRPLGPSPPAMTVNDPAHICETDARPFKFFRAMKALEHPKKFVCVSHIKASAIVPHRKLPLVAGVLRAADFEASLFT